MNAVTNYEQLLGDPNAVAAFAAAMSILATYLMIFAVIALALGVLMIVATWRIFKKAGAGGWKAIVPVYCDYTLYKIAWKKKYFWVLIVLCVLTSLLGELVVRLPEYGLWLNIVAVATAAAIIVIEIKCQVKLAKAFRKGGGFAVGLILLPFIFYPILGFGPAKYRRRKRRRQRALPPPEEG